MIYTEEIILRVATLTFHKVNNYGAVLQAYALQKYLLDNGHAAEVIDYRPNAQSKHLKQSTFYKIKRYLRNPKAELLNKYKVNKFENFRNKYIRISSNVFYGDNEILANPPVYDAYIVGSDQVWNSSLSNNSEAFYLHFVKGGKKIAYAGSFGKNEFNKFEINNIQEHLKNFDLISVREQYHQKLLLEMFNLNAEVTLDPVFLISKEKWIELAKCFKLPSKYILVYVLEYSEILFKHAIAMSKQLNCELVYLSLVSNRINGKCLEGIGPQEFLFLFANATYICTNSFHGTAFSIIFEKNFSVVKHTTRNSRIDNIISIAGLTNRYCDVDWNKMINIDYTEVNKRMETFIEKSKKFLLKGLKEH
jgi:hypothetical protein